MKTTAQPQLQPPPKLWKPPHNHSQCDQNPSRTNEEEPNKKKKKKSEKGAKIQVEKTHRSEKKKKISKNQHEKTHSSGEKKTSRKNPWIGTKSRKKPHKSEEQSKKTNANALIVAAKCCSVGSFLFYCCC